MAARFFINGGVDNLWGTTGNWSLTSGGAGGQAVPTSSDDVTFDNNSPNCTVSTAIRSAKTLTFTSGYVNTFTLNIELDVSGDINLGVNMIFAVGTGTLFAAASGMTLTSNGVIVGAKLGFGGAGGAKSYTFADNWTTTGGITFASTGTLTFNGSTINASGTVTFAAASTANVTGTTIIKFNNTCVWNSSTANANAILSLPIVVNLPGTLTISTANVKYSGAFVYTAGTVVTTGSTIQIGAAGVNADINSAGIIWNNVTFTSNFTCSLSSLLTSTGTITFTGATALIMSGSFGFTAPIVVFAASVNTTLASGITYSSTGRIISTATIGTPAIVQSSLVNSTKAKLSVSPGTLNDMRFTTITDVDSSDGNAVNLLTGTITRCININNYIVPITLAKIFN